MGKFSRVIIIVIDACGIGGATDAVAFGDDSAATIPNVAAAVQGLNMPTCARLGLGNIVAIKGVAPEPHAIGYWGRLREKSAGKDSTIGHWELMGVIVDKPLPTYPNGFPKEIIAVFEQRTGVRTIGNKTASGTEIIAELGERHMKTGELIVYTSADSVFQIAAHEDVVPIDKLYDYCRIAREILIGDHNVGRVIARPFVGVPGACARTERRKDFSALPPSTTALDLLAASGVRVISVGKIWDLFAGRGIDETHKSKDNTDGLRLIAEQLEKGRPERTLMFANLVDFDQEFGHRNNETGFARALEQFDALLAEQILPAMSSEDLLLITADHGCDPTMKMSTDHTREDVPLLVYSPSLGGGQDIGVRQSFADVGKTVLDVFEIESVLPGQSFLRTLE